MTGSRSKFAPLVRNHKFVSVYSGFVKDHESEIAVKS